MPRVNRDYHVIARPPRTEFIKEICFGGTSDPGFYFGRRLVPKAGLGAIVTEPTERSASQKRREF